MSQRRNPRWNGPCSTILDAIRFTTSLSPIRVASFNVIDALQAHRPEVQVQAVFTAAAIFARTLNADPHELLARTLRQLSDVLGPESQASAISDYVKAEIK